MKIVVTRSVRHVLWHDADLDEAIVGQLLADPDELLGRGAMLKDGDRSTVVRLDHGDRALTFKRYNRMGAIHTASHLLLRSRSRWSWCNGLRIMEAGLHTPAPRACLEQRWGPFRDRSYFLCDYVEGQPLLKLARREELEPADLERVSRAFAEIWRTLGTRRIHHGDMKATNFIVDEQRRLWLLDLDGMRHHWPGWWWRRQRAKDRARFMKNWQDLGAYEEVFRSCVDTA